MRHIQAEKTRLIDLYASGATSEQDYANDNMALDREAQQLSAKIGELRRMLHQPEIVEASLRSFSDAARARFEKCLDFDPRRQFLLDHVEKVVYDRGKVTVIGSVPMRDATKEVPANISFRIKGRVEMKGRSRHRTEKGRYEALNHPYLVPAA